MRGADTSGSDLDLLVRMDPDTDAFDLAEFIEDLRDVTGVDVDVVLEAGCERDPARSATRRARCERPGVSQPPQARPAAVRLLGWR